MRAPSKRSFEMAGSWLLVVEVLMPFLNDSRLVLDDKTFDFSQFCHAKVSRGCQLYRLHPKFGQVVIPLNMHMDRLVAFL